MVKWLAPSAAGLFALSVLPASAATTSCSTVAACVFGSNTSSGIGAEGSSKSGSGVSGVSTSGHGVNGTSSSSFGVVGITTENATSTGTARAGVLGEDSSTNKKAFNSGVAGSSTYGIGVSGTGGKYGGSFTSSSGTGLYASSAEIGETLTFDRGNGSPSPSSIDVYSYYGTYILGHNDGVIGVPSNGIDPNAGYGSPSNAAFRAYGNAGNNYDLLFAGEGCFGDPANEDDGCSDTVSIDAYGDATFAGTVTENGSPEVRTRSVSGKDVASYGSRSTSPTLEDLGKASLRSGAAYVALEPVFASTIDASAGYMVFITPEGNSHGLYTTQLTPRGFAVRENDGGKSSLTFDYRIVAHPADTKAGRLPLMVRRAKVPTRFQRHR